LNRRHLDDNTRLTTLSDLIQRVPDQIGNRAGLPKERVTVYDDTDIATTHHLSVQLVSDAAWKEIAGAQDAAVFQTGDRDSKTAAIIANVAEITGVAVDTSDWALEEFPHLLQAVAPIEENFPTLRREDTLLRRVKAKNSIDASNNRGIGRNVTNIDSPFRCRELILTHICGVEKKRMNE
jgi:hypothetical protein